MCCIHIPFSVNVERVAYRETHFNTKRTKSNKNRHVYKANLFMFQMNTVDSLLFVGYQFLWFSLVQVNHEIKYSTNDKFSIGVYAKPRN